MRKSLPLGYTLWLVNNNDPIRYRRTWCQAEYLLFFCPCMVILDLLTLQLVVFKAIMIITMKLAEKIKWNLLSFRSSNHNDPTSPQNNIKLLTRRSRKKPRILETLRFSRLNERNVSLVAICAVILVMQRLSSEATTCPDTMMRQVHQRLDRPISFVCLFLFCLFVFCLFFSYVVVITKSSIDMHWLWYDFDILIPVNDMMIYRSFYVVVIPKSSIDMYCTWSIRW